MVVRLGTQIEWESRKKREVNDGNGKGTRLSDANYWEKMRVREEKSICLESTRKIKVENLGFCMLIFFFKKIIN